MGDITKPVKPTPSVENIEDIKYIERLEDWDSKNYQIITWLGIVANEVISSQSTALVVTPGTSWLLDSTCCNHLTFDMSLLSSHIPIQSLPPIHYADGLGFSNGINDCHHSFFTDPSTNLFPTPNSPPNTTPCPPLTSESTQSRTTSVLPNLSSAPCEEPEHAPVRRSIRVRETPHLKEYRCFSIIMSLDEPSSYKEANTNPLWQQAMDDELQALAKTHT
ncbi:retrotransposon protein [Cucumis melo var. makuwa]|uniref:Retrotransposon protein n=1 Tax=Cucumis melo var. makuwa TaxID=1194695 RepID=A0A5D3D372_CUCMM|nr:retrotransposon protein [Cucumis melo var. makuwa]